MSEEPFTVEGYIADLQTKLLLEQAAFNRSVEEGAERLVRKIQEKVDHHPLAEPWPCEPSGPEYGYMVRFNPPHGKGMFGFEWPAHGYVQCLNFLKYAIGHDGGLSGFLHGEGDYRVVINEFVRGAPVPPTAQVFKTRLADVKHHHGEGDTDSHRTWCGWVKYTGTFAQVCQDLRAEGEYGATVAANAERCYAEADAAVAYLPLTDALSHHLMLRYSRSDALFNMPVERAQAIERRSKGLIRLAYLVDTLAAAAAARRDK